MSQILPKTGLANGMLHGAGNKLNKLALTDHLVSINDFKIAENFK